MNRRVTATPSCSRSPSLPSLARALLIAAATVLGPAIDAHPTYGPVEVSEVRVDLQAPQIVVPYGATQLAIDFAPSGGAVRARLILPAAYDRTQVRLQVALADGEHLDVRFLGTGRIRIGNHPLSKVPDRSVLELRQPQRTHRIILHDGNPHDHKSGSDPR